MSDSSVEVEDLEWEEWDGKSPFLHHCLAGSVAGVAEHTLLYPVDTVKTHMQAYCSTCPNNPANIGSKSAKIVCVGPPGAATTKLTSQAQPQPKHINHQGMGMWSTVRNLIKHGHAHGKINKHVSPKGARQAATFSGTSIPASTVLTKASSVSGSPQMSTGITRLWRGVQTMTTGCVPAHALYFSSYEIAKANLSTTIINPKTGVAEQHLGTLGASAAGVVSTFFHDIIMTPMDTIKQRMQLGHYNGMGHAFSHILQHEGMIGLYRSFGITLMTNLPYGMVVMSTNEFLRDFLLEIRAQNGDTSRVLDIKTTMLAGCGAGMVAAAVTAPLDCVKTRLQTQRFADVKPMHHDGMKVCKKAQARAQAVVQSQIKYNGLMDAFVSIVKEEGYVGLWRGVAPRLMTHTPAVAISWTTYETMKRWLS